jgi:hypothetical protein
MVSEVLPICPAAIQTGAFIGTAAVPRADGAWRRSRFTSFPKSPGAGRGASAFRSAAGLDDDERDRCLGRARRRRSRREAAPKDGEKTIHVPNGIPIVT